MQDLRQCVFGTYRSIIIDEASQVAYRDMYVFFDYIHLFLTPGAFKVYGQR